MTRSADGEILRLASAFFADPVGHPFTFDQYKVKYVLVSALPKALGNPAIYRTKRGERDAVPALTPLVQRRMGALPSEPLAPRRRRLQFHSPRPKSHLSRLRG